MSADDLAVSIDDLVAVVEIRRPPNNFFDVDLVRRLAEAYESLDADERCRAIVLCSKGRHFCAGADFSGRSNAEPIGTGQAGAGELYRHAARLMAAATPVVAAVQGTAVGGGLGLACSADFRVAGHGARFAANFARLGLHHGFGLSVTLPAIVGHQASLDLLYTGRRIGAQEAAALGLCDRLVRDEDPRPRARALAAEIAASAPLAVRAIRATQRAELLERFRAATERELVEQDLLRQTADWHEGIAAAAAHRAPRFFGR